MSKRAFILLVISLCMLPFPLAAQDTLTLDPSVSSVVSGGYWEKEKERGSYRIIVWSRGWEHVTSKVRVEWILEDSDKQENRVFVSSAVDSIPDWVWSLGQPALTYSRRVCEVTIDGTDPHDLEKASWVITLRGPAQMSVLKRK